MREKTSIKQKNMNWTFKIGETELKNANGSPNIPEIEKMKSIKITRNLYIAEI